MKAIQTFLPFFQTTPLRRHQNRSLLFFDFQIPPRNILRLLKIVGLVESKKISL